MKPPSFGPGYIAFFPMLAEIVQSKGYALAVHGSLQRDMDLVAVPWTDDAVSNKDLIDALSPYITGIMSAMFPEAVTIYPNIDGEKKPHGRIAYSINIGNGAFIDISIMPRIV